MWRAHRLNPERAGLWRWVFTLLVASAGCSDSGTGTEQVEGLRFVLQPAAIGAGVPMTVTVELLSASGTRLASATDQVTLTVSGGATLGGTTTVSALAGLATFADITVNPLGQNYQLTAHLGEITSTSSTFVVTAGPASVAQSTMNVPGNVVSGANATLTFAFRDAGNNVIANSPVSFSSNLAGVTFTPATGTTDASGAFSTVFRATSPGSAAITVNVGGTSITFPGSITVAPGAAALRFVTGPAASLVSGQPFTVAVEVLDNAGERLTTSTNQITLTLSAGALQGSATANAVAGLATFSDLSINGLATGITMLASSGALSVPSAPFSVVAGPPSPAQSTLQFSSPLSSNTASTATFTFRDAATNVIANAAVNLASTLAGVTMTPSTGTTNASGVFTSVITPSAAGAGSITATVNGTPVMFNVTVLGQCTVGTITLDVPLNGTIDPASGCLLGSHQAASYRFAVPPGPNAAAVSLVGAGTGFFPEVGITLDPPNSSTIVCGQGSTPGNELSCEWLLPPGANYRALIASSSGSTGGAFTLTPTSTGTGLAGCRAKILLGVTATYTGQALAASDCGVQDAGFTYYTDFFFAFDPRPCTIRLQAAYPVYLQIDFENGQPSQVVQGQTDHQIALASCAPGGGEILINASTFDALVTGPYTLTVTFTGTAPPAGAALRSPQSIGRTLPATRMSDVFGRRIRERRDRNR